MSDDKRSAEPVRWGILGTANIALTKVIPAMRQSALARVEAIASRDIDKARKAASAQGIDRAYGTYEELLEDPAIEAVYIPLPNHLHVPWTIKAAQAGKHVLCEKPIATSAAEARQLLEVRRHTGRVIEEAFMVRTHPQWLEARRLARSGRIGDLRLVTGHFSYFRRDPHDVRSRLEFGGGALFDIGCYPITMSRWLFDEEPTEAIAMIERDPDMHIDRLLSAMLRFPSGQAAFTCAGQLVPFQRVEIFGTRGRIMIEIPFNAPPPPPTDRPCRIFVDDGSKFASAAAEVIEFPIVDQYTLQTDHFCRALRGDEDVPVTLEDSIANLEVIDALFRSAETHRWERPS